MSEQVSWYSVILLIFTACTATLEGYDKIVFQYILAVSVQYSM